MVTKQVCLPLDPILTASTPIQNLDLLENSTLGLRHTVTSHIVRSRSSDFIKCHPEKFEQANVSDFSVSHEVI